MVHRLVRAVAIFIAATSLLYNSIYAQLQVSVTVDRSRPIHVFDPATTLGAAIDGHDVGEIGRRLRPPYVRQMLEAGLGPITYRLRTELGNEAWHWNTRGKFSDSIRQQGYWTGSTDPTPGGISLANGYRLPRRGNTTDEANNDGYSRIDDGDPRTFWKSNPYLDHAFTHDEDSMHPQWVVIDLGYDPVPVNGIRIVWGDQFATDYEVEYSAEDLSSDYGLRPDKGWQKLQSGTVTGSKRDNSVHRLAPQPVTARFIRITLRKAAHAGRLSPDPRDNVGFAIRELYIGAINAHGVLADSVHPGTTNHTQSTVYVSSTDPWHTAADLDRNEEHAGFDRLVATGLTRGLPMMVPVGILYDTPANAAAEIKYLINRGIKIDRIELGEEADGQNVNALDYAALYVQFADAIHNVAPDAKLGGPSFQDIVANLIDRKEGAG
ncbi:MAG: discoidin domain-containing protein, partial [Acidobacteria bacterium]|nr:discoidin domain-containing protein [Acidobacteriota bacterium]